MSDKPRVAFFSSYWSVGQEIAIGGSDYWRLVLPASQLYLNGWDVIFGRSVATSPDGTLRVMDPAGNWHDDREIIVWQRWMGRDTAEHLLRARAAGQVVINDVDDHYWALPEGHQALAGTDPELHPDYHREHYRETLEASSLITTSTPYLVRELDSWGPPIQLLRNYVSLEAWGEPRMPGDHVGWVGALPWRGADLELFRETVVPWLRSRQRFFYHGGHMEGSRTAEESLDYDRVSTREACSVEEYPKLWDPLRVALVPIDDTPFGAAKCLDTSVRVMTDSGVLPVGEICEGDRVWHDQKWRLVEGVEYSQATEGLRIRTALGLSWDLTPNHRLRSSGVWRRADKLAIGDVLDLAPEEWPQSLPYVRVPWPAASRPTKVPTDPTLFTRAESGPGIVIDERWGRLLGVYAGDGGIQGKGVVILSCDGQDQDLIDLLMADWEQVGIAPVTESRRTWGGEVIRRRSVAVSSVTLTRVFEAMGIATAPRRSHSHSRKRIIRVPDCIWRSPRSVVAAFLSGLFEADGTTPSRGYATVSLTTKEETLARDVQRLLVGFGIFATVRSTSPKTGEYVGRTYWKIGLGRANSEIFAREINFISSRKRGRLAIGVARPYGSTYRGVPVADPIISIEPTRVTPVDIQVEGEAFAAAGVVSHNSWVKGLEACARGIPFIASKHAEYDALGVGLTAENPSDWTRWLDALEDPAVYEREARANRARAEELSIESNWWRWDEVLRYAATLNEAPSGGKPTRRLARGLAIAPDAETERQIQEIPSATTFSERVFMRNYAAHVWDGQADVFENGPLLGGSTRALALGMLANPNRREDAKIWTYDWFSLAEPLDLPHGTFESLIERDLLSPETYHEAIVTGSFKPIFCSLHFGRPYWETLRTRVGYLPGHRGEVAKDGAQEFETRGCRFSLALVDGCKSWYGTKFWLKEIAPALSSGAHVLFQDFGQYTCFWLPMLVDAFADKFRSVAMVDHTYAFQLLAPITPGEVEERFPDEPTDLCRADYDEAFDRLHNEAVARGDGFAPVSLAAQRAAAYAYIGDADDARKILDDLLADATNAPLRSYLMAARRSPTYRPEGEPILL